MTEPMMDETFLDKMTQAYRKLAEHETTLVYYALRAAKHPFDEKGYPKLSSDGFEWPFTDVKWDDYDSSFETKGTRNNWEPSEDFLAAMWKLGFVQCWICYEDGTEKTHMEPSYAARMRELNKGFMERYRAAFRTGVEKDGVPRSEQYDSFAKKHGYPSGWTEHFIKEM